MTASMGDHLRLRYVLGSEDETRDVFVEISRTAEAAEPATLPAPVDEAVARGGRSVIESQLNRTEPFAKVVITSTSVRSVP